MFESIFKKPAPPQPTKCHACGTVAAEAVCHACKTERPAYTAMKRISARERELMPITNAVPCRYHPKAICGCGGKGTCLEAA